MIEVGENPRYPYKPRIPLTVIVNPTIEPIDDEIFAVNEGCLSVPGIRGEVPRARQHPRPLPRPPRRAARGGAPRADRGNVPTRGRPPRRDPVPRPRQRSADVHDLGGVRAPPPRRVRRPGHGARREGRVVTAFWCELAWLGGAEPEAGRPDRVRRERIASVAAGVAATDGARRARRPDAARPGQRPFAQLPARDARTDPACDRRLVLDVARADVRAGDRRATRTASSHSHGRRSPRWRSRG